MAHGINRSRSLASSSSVALKGEDSSNTLNQEGVENLHSTLRACTDLEQQASRLKQLVGSFRI